MILLEAHRARDEAKRLIAAGTDPSSARKRAKREALVSAGNTFGSVATEWFQLNESRWVKSYASRLRSRLDDDLLPVLAKRPIAEIEPLEVLDAIRAIERRDAIEMARRVMQMASGIFRYGVGGSGKYAPLAQAELCNLLHDFKKKNKSSPLMQLADLYLYQMCFRGYVKSYRPYKDLITAGRLIDCHLQPEEIPSRGIKYSCWELVEVQA